MGNRIGKIETPSGGGTQSATFYSHDASGNVMATYDLRDKGAMDGNLTSGEFSLNEVVLFGSSRLGTVSIGRPVDSLTAHQRFYFEEKANHRYELTNHLGNVMAVISGKTEEVALGTETVTMPHILFSTDYYPFGMEVANSGVVNNTAKGEYRFGFQVQEKDDEVKGDGNSYDFGARMYDSRVGQWLSIGPLAKKYPSASPYNFVLGNLIYYVDPDGKEVYNWSRSNMQFRHLQTNRASDVVWNILNYNPIFTDALNEFRRVYKPRMSNISEFGKYHAEGVDIIFTPVFFIRAVAGVTAMGSATVTPNGNRWTITISYLASMNDAEALITMPHELDHAITYANIIDRAKAWGASNNTISNLIAIQQTMEAAVNNPATNILTPNTVQGDIGNNSANSWSLRCYQSMVLDMEKRVGWNYPFAPDANNVPMHTDALGNRTLAFNRTLPAGANPAAPGVYRGISSPQAGLLNTFLSLQVGLIQFYNPNTTVSIYNQNRNNRFRYRDNSQYRNLYMVR